MKHILSIADLSKSEMDEIIDVTQKVMVPIARKRQKFQSPSGSYHQCNGKASSDLSWSDGIVSITLRLLLLV